MVNIDINDIITDLESFSNSKIEKELLQINISSNNQTKQLSQEDLFLLFKDTFSPYIEESICEIDKERFLLAEKENNPESFQASMSFNFVDDVLVYARYYLQQLDFGYFLKTGRHLFIVSQSPENFLFPVHMLFHITNFLSFSSFTALNQVHLDLKDFFEKLKHEGYCSNNINDPNIPFVQFLIKQEDFVFSLSCSNNLLSINAPIELKQDFYFKLIENFIKNILNNSKIKFIDVGKNKEQDYLDIYPAFVESKKIFYKHFAEQLFRSK